MSPDFHVSLYCCSHYWESKWLKKTTTKKKHTVYYCYLSPAKIPCLIKSGVATEFQNSVYKSRTLALRASTVSDKWVGLVSPGGRRRVGWPDLEKLKQAGSRSERFCLPELEAQILSWRWEGLLGEFSAGWKIRLESFLFASRARKNGLGLMGGVALYTGSDRADRCWGPEISSMNGEEELDYKRPVQHEWSLTE